MFEVSVIIPVYNAEKYIVRAIESIINQAYVGEVIVVDDGYKDGALEKCLELQKVYTKLKVLRHPEGENRGAGISRNLGIEYAIYPYIAFLDADDYCLEGRFTETKKIFESNELITVAYEPVGTVYENEEAKKQFCKWRKISVEQAEHYITNMRGGYKGKDFLNELLKGRKGSPCTLGITIEKKLLKNISPWFKGFRLHEDSEFWTRLAYYGYFSTSKSSRPIAMRWVHLENRISGRNYASAYLKEQELFNWAKKECENVEAKRLITKRYIYAQTQYYFRSSNKFVLLCCKMRYLFFITIDKLF